jgi:dipeptidyl aminopeptidase/acylaminoacyl peptidase
MRSIDAGPSGSTDVADGSHAGSHLTNISMRPLPCLLLAIVLPAVAAIPTPPREVTDPRTPTSPANPNAAPVPIADLFYTRNNGGIGWSPDGKHVVISTNLTGRLNLWKTSSQGSWPVQLAHSDDRQLGAAWSPDGKWIVFESDTGGNELFHLFAIPASGGPTIDLTQGNAVSESAAHWSPDGAQVAFERKLKDAPVTDIALLDWSTHTVKLLTHETTQDHLWQLVAWGADGRSIYANRLNAASSDSSAWRIDVSSGKTEELLPHAGEILIQLTGVSSDGQLLALTSNQNGGLSRAAVFHISDRTYEWLDSSPWESNSGEFSPDGKSLVWMRDANGRSDILSRDLAARRDVRIDLPPGDNWLPSDGRIFSRDGRMLVKHQASNTPADYWIVGPDGSSKQLTRSALASLDAVNLPEAHLVSYKSFDGTIISAYLWLPFNLRRDGRAPAVVLPHGGPVGQTIDDFNRTAAALSTRGYICIAPNVRGSTGYGMAFQKANIKDLGGGDLQDEVFAAKFLVATGYVDAKKIAIAGGSYGGYLTLMALAKTPSVWAAGVDSYGIVNWLTTLQNEDAFLQEYDKALLGDPVLDKGLYEARSPITFIKQIKAPLLVLHGDNDIRVPKEESEQVVGLLRAQNGIVEAHYYSNEGHGFSKRENQIDALQRTVGWLDLYLKGGTVGTQ